MTGRFDEPRKHRGFLLLLGLAALATVPLPFAGGETAFALGLPLWLWWSAAATALLAGLTAWGFLRYWRDPDAG